MTPADSLSVRTTRSLGMLPPATQVVLLARSLGTPALIDDYLPQVEEWVEQSGGEIRADKAHAKLLALGCTGSERAPRRAVAVVKKDHRSGRRRVHRPWVTEPGMWLQYDFGDGPVSDVIKTTLFCA